MSTQPEALRLADALKAATGQTDAEDDVIHVARWFVEDAAAELCRLSIENAMLWGEREEPHAKIAMYIGECNRLETERDALLEALTQIAGYNLPDETAIVEVARAAIKAVGEGK